jgi:hypothetical protein
VWAPAPVQEYAGFDQSDLSTFDANDVDAVVCEVKCAAGEQPSLNGEGCEPCPENFRSAAGDRACRRSLVHYSAWLRDLDESDEGASIDISQSDSDRLLRIKITLHKIPTDFFETRPDREVVYLFDIGATQRELEERSGCSTQWRDVSDGNALNTTSWEVPLSYWDLDGECNLAETQDGNNIVRKGYAKAYLVALIDPEHTVWSKIFPIEIVYDTIAAATFTPLNIWIPSWEDTLYFKALGHESIISLWEDNFSRRKQIEAFYQSERVHLEHSLQDENLGWQMKIIAVVLSENQDPQEPSTNAWNMTTGFRNHPSVREGSSRVSFLAIHLCDRCFLHVASEVSLPDGRRRRLDTVVPVGGAGAASDTDRNGVIHTENMRVTPRPSAPSALPGTHTVRKVISMTVDFSLTDLVSKLMFEEGVRTATVQAAASSGITITEGLVTVEIAQADRRLSGDTAATNAIDTTVVVAMPPDSSESAAIEDVTSALDVGLTQNTVEPAVIASFGEAALPAPMITGFTSSVSTAEATTADGSTTEKSPGAFLSTIGPAAADVDDVSAANPRAHMLISALFMMTAHALVC